MKLPFWPDPLGHRDIKFGLNRVHKLLKRLGDPHLNLPPTIHVAGTNGKGSTIAYLQAILKKKKYRIHRYTSPHLVNFNERIVLAGQEIQDKYLNQILTECKEAAETEPKIKITFFEGITVAAFLAFSRVPADILLLETGMGGRLDATNVIKNPLLTIITPISLDHTEFLGKNISDITFEKAGIIKKNCPVIVGKQPKAALEVIKKQAKEKGSMVYAYKDDWQISHYNDALLFAIKDIEISLPLPNLIGEHQIQNAGLAISALCEQKVLEVDQKAIIRGLSAVKWPARLEEVVNGKFVDLLSDNYQLFLDSGHNEAGAKTILDWINKENIDALKRKQKKASIYVICGMLKSKNCRAFLKYLSGATDFLVGIDIKSDESSRTGSGIATIANKLGVKSVDAGSFEEAFKYIAAIQGDSVEGSKKSLIKKIVAKKSNKTVKIIICGSIYLAGQFLEENSL